MYPVHLQGSRIHLRELSHDDAPAVQRYASDKEAVRYMIWGPNTPEDTENFLRDAMAKAREEPRRAYELAIVRQAGLDGQEEHNDEELIGAAGIRVQSTEHRSGDLGYILRRDQWGRGLATEAVGILLRFGFEELGLHRIYATCDPENGASARVLEKSGMTLEGRMRHHNLVRGAWRDSLLYSILEDEWRR